MDLLGNDKYLDIPFELKQGFIIVEARFQNIVTLNFIFDTGAENTIIFDHEIPDLLNVRYDQRIKIMGSDFTDELYANIARRINLRLGPTRTVKRDIVILEENILLLEEKLGIKVDGILGGSFFQNLIVRINFAKKNIRLINPNGFKESSLKNYRKFNIEIDNNKPYIDAVTTLANGTKRKFKFLIDTGASLPFLLHTDTDSLLTLPEKTITGNLGYGISGILKGYIGKVNKLELGPYHFANLMTSFQEMNVITNDSRAITRNGIIGNHLLRRFYVTLDYLNGYAYIKPIRKKKYNKSFDFDRSGMVIFAVGVDLNDFFIQEVLENSPAAQADIRPGDIIVKVNRRKARSLTLEIINTKLQRKPGKKVKLEIERDGERIKKEIILRNWFEDSENK